MAENSEQPTPGSRSGSQAHKQPDNQPHSQADQKARSANLAARIARQASVVGAATLLSRILGFIRDLTIAFALGASPLADAFFVAFRLPNLARRLFGEGSLTMAFIPVFTATAAEDGDEEAHILARAAFVWLLGILGALVVAAVVFADPLTRLVAPGFVRDPELLQLTIRLVRICLPYSLLICSVALCMGILNAKQHFLGPALAPSVLNVVLITGALGAVFTGADVPVVLAWSVVVAGFFQFLIQQPFLRAKGFAWKGPVRMGHKGVRHIGLMLLPTVFGAAVYQITILIGTLLASYLPTGSVSYLYYADRLVQFPLGVFGVAVSTAALPSLSALAGAKDGQGFSDALSGAVRLTLFISLPAAAGLMALADPIVALLFQRGAFTPEAVHATGLALGAYALGLPAFAAIRPLVSAYYAVQNTRTPVIIAALCLILYTGCALWLMGPMNHVGLALAATVSSWVNALLLGMGLARGQGGMPPVPMWSAVVRPCLGFLMLSAGMGLAAYETWLATPQGWRLAGLALIPVWGAGYLWLATICHMEEAALLLGVVGRRFRRRSR